MNHKNTARVWLNRFRTIALLLGNRRSIIQILSASSSKYLCQLLLLYYTTQIAKHFNNCSLAPPKCPSSVRRTKTRTAGAYALYNTTAIASDCLVTTHAYTRLLSLIDILTGSLATALTRYLARNASIVILTRGEWSRISLCTTIAACSWMKYELTH